MSTTTDYRPRSVVLHGVQVAALGGGTVVCLALALTTTLLLVLAAALDVSDLQAFGASHRVREYVAGAACAWAAFLALSWALQRSVGRYTA